MNDPIRAALAATMNDKIAAALASTDTAARALWEAMGAPGEYNFGKAVHGTVPTVTAFFRGDDFRGDVDLTSNGNAAVCVYRGDVPSMPSFEHHGSLDSARAALAAYLGAS
jgi:hypothetical protein